MGSDCRDESALHIEHLLIGLSPCVQRRDSILTAYPERKTFWEKPADAARIACVLCVGGTECGGWV